jgi:hypothetical protein
MRMRDDPVRCGLAEPTEGIAAAMKGGGAQSFRAADASGTKPGFTGTWKPGAMLREVGAIPA